MSQRSSTSRLVPSPNTSRDITFLPVNQPQSPGDLRPRRGYQSCDNCRTIKKRCEPSSQPSVCWRCEQESRICLTTHQRKRRKLRPPVGSAVSDVSGNAEDLFITSNTPSTDALPQSSHCVSAREEEGKVGPSDLTSTPQGVAAISGNPHWGPNTKERILSTSILDACDALNVIAASGTEDGVVRDGMISHNSQSPGTGRGIGPASHQILSTSAPIASVPPATAWDRFFLVKRGIIQPHEAIEYLSFYFANLWALFPIIPQWYASADHYAWLVAEEPVLTISLLTITSRYHVLSGFNGQARSERIHWRTWPWVQRLFQSSIWGCSAMRSLGAITALLLFIEWHPRVINSPEDLIGDYGDIELFEPVNQRLEGEQPSVAGLTDAGRRCDSSNIPERLNIIAPAYRSNKVSRMMLSTAISLAQELGCLREEQVSERPSSKGSSEQMSIRLAWTRNIRTSIRLTDEALTLRLRVEPQLASSSYAEFDRVSSGLTTDGFSEATVDLASHMCQARELLRSWRKSQQGTGPAVSIAAWDNYTEALNTWETKYVTSGRDTTLAQVCLYIEYYYIRLCGLSPASHPFESSPKTHPANAYIKALSHFAEEATRASVNMLELLTQFSSSSQPFMYAPVTLKRNEYLDRPNPFITLITQTVKTMKHNAPDDTHMSQRYAALLDILVSAALRTSADRGRNSTTINSSPLPTAQDTVFDGLEMDPSEEWIFDESFWNSLPDMVGLDGVPGLIMSPVE